MRLAAKILFVVTLTFGLILLFPGPLFSRSVNDARLRAATQGSDFSWGTITPTQALIWHECYEKLQCARLEVPLDYSSPHGCKAAIALIRKPALVPPSDASYKGPILFNPGGPGDSGVDFLSGAGSLFSVILGPQFDLVSFDPRGIGRSTPRASIFKTDAERALFDASASDLDLFNGSARGLSRLWGISQIVGMLAADRNDEYLSHITTPNTARDMLSIIQAYGEEALQYWGFSYGTILGATFATMFPDKVKRMVLDGVGDAEDYFAANWKTNLIDTHKTFDSFFTGCAEAGPTRCAFYSSQPDDIRRNLTRVLQQVRQQPIPVKAGDAYGLVDLKSIRTAIFLALYKPRALFSPLADGIAKLAEGNALPMFKLSTALSKPRFECSCEDTRFDVVSEGTITFICNDGEKVPGKLSDAQHYFGELLEQSEWADMWVELCTTCGGWPISQSSFKQPFQANTNHPILLIGNTADPATPLASAKRMSMGFKDSVVITQDSAGHCSLASPSLCTQWHVRRYFNDGVLPDPGTICESLGSNFPPKPPMDINPKPIQAPLDREAYDSEGDSSLRTAIEELATLYPIKIPSLWL